MFNLTKADLTFVLTHIIWFIAAYAACMAGHPTADWFSWGCLSNGLIAAGATSTGSFMRNSYARDKTMAQQENNDSKQP